MKIREQDETVKLLDDLITKKGEESLLAVVHADGNNMGSKISEMLTDKKDYDSCVNIMREFTADTAKAFGKSGLDAMQKCQQQLKEDYKDKYDEKAFFFRKIIADGDDMTLCAMLVLLWITLELILKRLRIITIKEKKNGDIVRVRVSAYSIVIILLRGHILLLSRHVKVLRKMCTVNV